jgi:radical SAM superfamily enzyme YgiQ (UPF0313 family)
LKVLLITPPFTQLNTAYPATAYIKGFLNTLGITSLQIDLSIEVTLNIFSTSGLKDIFDQVEANESKLSNNAFRIFTQRQKYIQTIQPVMSFLQNKNQTLALSISSGHFLPRASRFELLDDLEWAFGTMGTHDKARHLATLYLEDLGDFITEVVDHHFGFSRYAERLGRTATHFDELYLELLADESLVSRTLRSLLHYKIKDFTPDLVCITAPFPGNVFGAFKCGQIIKSICPTAKIAFGGGFANTELRSIYDERVFEFVDFITLDDGEAPLLNLIEHLCGKREKHKLKRTFCLDNHTVTYCNGSEILDIPQREVGTPDYSDLPIDRYISVIEVVNPMHRMWSDGWWNKLTLAHGCYWGKCSFCDVTLDYIKRYEPVNAALLCDRIETIITQTGQNGFHFVDEAAPPALMRDLSLEILRRGLSIVWWANIRFEKSFTEDLCRLLKAAGCIAVSGGLEVASDRLLDKMKKGVTVAQVANVSKAFTDADIMVHAYLMYGFPTQSAQETIDSLEMVRQMFEQGIIQSGFWHQFAMTAHSPVGLHPDSFGVKHIGPEFGGFAENDFFHDDPKGTEHERFSDGLKVSLFNYMQGLGLDDDLSIWFDFRIPNTKISPSYISKCLETSSQPNIRTNDIVIWLGGDAVELILLSDKKSKKLNKDLAFAEVIFSGINDQCSVYLPEAIAEWFIVFLPSITPDSPKLSTVAEMKSSFENEQLGDFQLFLDSDYFKLLKQKGLMLV